jgi:hypothetical protein
MEDTTLTSPVDEPARHQQDVSLNCVGTPQERGDALRAVVEDAQDGDHIVLGSCEYFVTERLLDEYDNRPGILYNSGIRIGDVSDLTIRGAGQGRTVVKFARPVYIGFEILSNTNNLTISDMTIAGSIVEPLCQENSGIAICYDGKTSDHPNTHGISSPARAERVRNVRFTGLEVRDLAVGISIGVWGSRYCDYSEVIIEGNHVHDMHGTHAGSGYGIHLGCASGVTVRGNLVERTGRHAIYAGRSPTDNPRPTLIIGNTIIDHGHDEFRDERVAAISAARSDNVVIVDNTLIRSHPYAISVEYDPDTGLDCTRCVVIGNKFVSSGDFEDIWVNSLATAWLWGNVHGHGQPATVRDDSGMAADAAAPGMFWAGTQAITSMFDPETRTDRLYVLQNDVLHVVKPDYGGGINAGWRDLRTSTGSWPGVVGMTSGEGRVFLWQGDALHAITPVWADAIWPSTTLEAWSGEGDLEYGSDGLLYIAGDHALRSVDLTTGSVTQWNATADTIFGLAMGREAAYMRIANGVYALQVGTFGASLRLVD